jgi:hypothetical protein
MRTPIRNFVFATILVATGQTAFAGKAEGDACAAALNPTGQQMYAAVAPNVSSGDDMQSQLRSNLKPLVQSGSLTQTDARANAQAVITCLEKL